MPKPSSPRLLSSVVVGLAVVIGLSAAACDATGSSPSGTPEMTAATDLAGTSWTLLSIAGVPAVASAPPELSFDAAGTVSGTTGCNSLNGTYSIDGASLAFGPLATTKRACEQPLMNQETALLDALTGVAGWVIDEDGLLHLTGASGLVLTPDAP